MLEALETNGDEETTLEFLPAISPRERVIKAELNGKPTAFKVEPSENDQHVMIRIPVRREKTVLRVAIANDFGVAVNSSMPQLGRESEGLRVLCEKWSPNKDSVDIEVSGTGGRTYSMDVWNGAAIAKVEGATVTLAKDGPRRLTLTLPESTERYPHLHVVIQFKTR